MRKTVFALLLILACVHGTHPEEQKMTPAVRDVTPPGVIRVYRSSEEPAISETGLPKFADIQVLQNGTLRSESKTIQLYGIALPDRKKLCTSPAGLRWTCGAMAFVALRNLVQSQSISCNIVSEREKDLLGQCKVEQTDISAWLLQNGWAELAPSVSEKLYVDAAAIAKAKASGLWGNGPPENADKPLKWR
jgi:endonuclease YncB( thermonuclease family)